LVLELLYMKTVELVYYLSISRILDKLHSKVMPKIIAHMKPTLEETINKNTTSFFIY